MGTYTPEFMVFSAFDGNFEAYDYREPTLPLEKDLQFVDFHCSLDNLFRKIREEGVGAESKQTATISIEEEKLRVEGVGAESKQTATMSIEEE